MFSSLAAAAEEEVAEAQAVAAAEAQAACSTWNRIVSRQEAYLSLLAKGE